MDKRRIKTFILKNRPSKYRINKPFREPLSRVFRHTIFGRSNKNGVPQPKIDTKSDTSFSCVLPSCPPAFFPAKARPGYHPPPPTVKATPTGRPTAVLDSMYPGRVVLSPKAGKRSGRLSYRLSRPLWRPSSSFLIKISVSLL